MQENYGGTLYIKGLGGAGGKGTTGRSRESQEKRRKSARDRISEMGIRGAVRSA